MDFSLPPEAENHRQRARRFVVAEIMPVEADRANCDDKANIALPLLRKVRAKVKAAGLRALQMPAEGDGLLLAAHQGPPRAWVSDAPPRGKNQ